MEYNGSNSSTRESFLVWCDSVFTANTFYDFNAIHKTGISDDDRYMVYVTEMLNGSDAFGPIACHIQNNSLYGIMGVLLLVLILLLKRPL